MSKNEECYKFLEEIGAATPAGEEDPVDSAIDQVEKAVKNLIGKVGITSPVISLLVKTVTELETMKKSNEAKQEEVKPEPEPEIKEEVPPMTIEDGGKDQADIPMSGSEEENADNILADLKSVNQDEEEEPKSPF